MKVAISVAVTFLLLVMLFWYLGFITFFGEGGFPLPGRIVTPQKCLGLEILLQLPDKNIADMNATFVCLGTFKKAERDMSGVR
jgi:hypothetical protein